jgi:hypothetical protein
MAKNFGRVNVSITASTGGLTAGLARAGKSLGGFASTVGSAVNPLRMLGSVAGSTFGQLSMFSMAQSAVNTFTSMTAAAAESIDVQSKLSRRLGTTYGELAGLKLAGDLAGVGIEQIGTAMTKSDVAMQKAVGGSKQAQKAFANLGLDAGQLQGMSTADRFEAIASAIANIQSPAERAAAAVALFGRSGATMLPLFEGGAESIRKARQEAERFGLTLTNAQGQNVENMNDSFTRVYASIQGIVQQVVAHLAPAVTGIAQTFTDYVGTIGGANIGQAIGEALLNAAEYLAGVGDYLIANFAPSVQKVFAYLSQIGGQWNSVFQFGSRVASFFSSVGRTLEAAFGLLILGITGPVEGLLYAAKKIGDALFLDTSTIDGAVQQMAAFNKQVSKDIDKNFGKAAENFKAAFADDVAPAAGAAIATPLTDAVKGFRDAARKAAASIDKSTEQQARAPVVAATLRVSSSDLRAVVVGTAEGEAFRNAVARGSDPRLDVKDDAKRAADAAEEGAQHLEEIAKNLDPVALATIMA